MIPHRTDILPGVQFDLDQLGAMHPALERVGEVELYRRRGVLALARARHRPGVAARVVNGKKDGLATIRWTAPKHHLPALEVLADNRVTEDGAEAVALAFVHARSEWTVSRRMQRGASADWLLTGPARARLVLALEVSGVAEGDADARLKVKLAQVAGVTEKGCVCAALVVGFEETSILASAVGGKALP